ncbi:hypothetical protein [Peterkaempfera bronchialis]|uniref:hypothetical protein n=1 Tax=Peterkaempfera bronchialis TaxID=2126346 RepID=UPI003C2BD2E8
MRAFDERPAAGEDGPEAVVGRRLAELAVELEVGSPPYEAVLGGGRRRRARRRLTVAGTVAAVVLATAGGVALTGGGERPHELRVAASGTAGPTAADGSAPSTRSPAAPTRDPLKPTSVVLAHGRSEGREWKAWAALWPAARDLAQARQQADLLWERRHAAIPHLPKPTEEDVRLGFRPGEDLVELYLTVDGKRLVDDSVHTTSAPGVLGSGALRTPPHDALEGTLLGFKGAEMGRTPVLLAGVRPDVARIRVTWRDGTVDQPVPVTVADSPIRWFAVAKRPGTSAASIKLYDAKNRLLATDTDWLA